ncbi:uncharacterized protein [Vicugna pacos]|uniref:Vomeronasal type-1 receptor n=1 Tax=Vicugna pacos TaxID=30538 RepID=A0ABM5DUQ8_VICPA
MTLSQEQAAVTSTLNPLSRQPEEEKRVFPISVLEQESATNEGYQKTRMGRDVSMGTTCILSIFQVIMISPSGSRLAELKVKAPSVWLYDK